MIEPKKIPRKEFKRHNRRSFLLAGINMLCGAFGLRWVLTSDGDKDMTPDALQQGFLANEKFWKRIFSPQRQNSATPAPPPGTKARINGDIGLDDEIDLQEWVLEYDSPTMKKTFTLQELERLPRCSSQSEFRCIEGWSMPIGFEGIRFSEFLSAIDPEAAKLPYVGLETPAADYYVGIDMDSMLHPQTVLADRMNGAPLGKEHGEPLRLIIPVKYGIKSLKRVGRIFISQDRPRDYWAENGYDWYSGH